FASIQRRIAGLPTCLTYGGWPRVDHRALAVQDLSNLNGCRCLRFGHRFDQPDLCPDAEGSCRSAGRIMTWFIPSESTASALSSWLLRTRTDVVKPNPTDGSI